MRELRSADGIVWQVMPKCLQMMENFSVDMLENAHTIKSSAGRSVSFVAIDGISCVLKIFYTPTLWDKIRVWLFSSRANLEWKYLHFLRLKGLSVAEPVAIGKRGMTTYLIIKKIPEAKTLKQLVFEAPLPLPYARKRELSNALAQLLAHMHNEKIIHRDLHFANLVQDLQGNLYLLDLHDVVFCQRMGAKDCLKNLAMFGSSFSMCISSADYLRFLKEYRKHSRFLGEIPWLNCVALAKKRLAEYQLSFWRKRAKRCLKNNKYFRKIRLDAGIGFCIRKSDIYQSLKNIEGILKQAKSLKSSRTTMVAKTACGIVKKYRRKKKRNLWIDCFRRSRAKRAWLSSYHCLARGILTAKPLGYLEKRKIRLLISCCIVSEEIYQAQTAREYLQAFGTNPLGEAFLRKRDFLRQLGRIVRLMHLRELTHRDLKLNNLLVDKNHHLHIIDMDGLKDMAHMGKKRRVKDLRRLVRALKTVPLTFTDRWRFLSSYLPYAKKDEKAQWQKKLDL